MIGDDTPQREIQYAHAATLPVAPLPAVAPTTADRAVVEPAQVCGIAVLIPCYNEAPTIAQVVRGFAQALPGARIYVYDNNSRDGSAQQAAAAGAIVRGEIMQGKGHVVRRMFRDVDADYYVLVDGDGTYDPALAARMLATAASGPYDLVNGVRVSPRATAAYRRGHQLGNRLLTGMVRLLFGNRVRDMLSGYKVLSRRFVKSFPALSTGFEIETELTVHALSLSLPVAHVETSYAERPEGSASKLRTYRDGWKILVMIANLCKQERPLLFFSAAGFFLALCSLALSVPVVLDYLRTGLVPRLPTAVLSTGLMLIAFICGACGLILDTVTRGRREAKMLAYLAVPHVERALPQFGDVDAIADGASDAAIGIPPEAGRSSRPRRRIRAALLTVLALVLALAIALGTLVALGVVRP